MSIFASKAKSAGGVTEGDGTYNEIFRGISVSSFPAPVSGSIVTVSSDSSVADVLSTLATSKILAAPVRNNQALDSASLKEKYLGIIDFNTIVHWMMGKTWGMAPRTLEELKGLKAAFKTTKIGELFLEGSHTPFVPVDQDSSLLDVMIFLGKYGIHRVWKVDSDEITNVVTQSGLLEVLAQNLGSFSGIASKSIHTLGLGHLAHVTSVSIHDTFWEAFRQIHEKKISAVPVLGDAGEIVGNISARDLRTKILDPVQFATLAKPISEFFVKGKVFTVKESDTLEHVVRTFQSTRVHRLYVVNAAGHPTGVVSLRDVLAQFVREPSSEDGESSYLAFFK